MSVPTYLPVLPYDALRVCCVLCSCVVSGKSVKARNAGCFECPAPMQFSLLHLAGMGSMCSGVFGSSVDMRVKRRLCFA